MGKVSPCCVLPFFKTSCVSIGELNTLNIRYKKLQKKPPKISFIGSEFSTLLAL